MPLAPFESELIGEARREDGIGELLLLPTGLAARIRVMLVFAIVLPPTFGSREDEPVADVGHLFRPAPIGVGLAFASAKPFDDRLHLEEFRFGIFVVLAARQRPFGAGAQILLEIADFRIHALAGLQTYEPPWVVVNCVKGLVDLFDPLPDRLPFAAELRLEVGDFADGI